jgi:hypothetical protein
MLEWQNDIEDRLLTVEKLLDKRGIRSLTQKAVLGGSNWEVSERYIATWAAGSSPPLEDDDTYAALVAGSLKIRGGAFDISTAVSGAHMELDSDGLRGYNVGGSRSVHLDWSSGAFWFLTGGFGGTEADPTVELDATGNVSIEGTLTMGNNGIITRPYVYRMDWGGLYFQNGTHLWFVDDINPAYQNIQGLLWSESTSLNNLTLGSYGNAATVGPAALTLWAQGYPYSTSTQFGLIIDSAAGWRFTDYNLVNVHVLNLSATTFNEQGADIDFRIESDTQTHMFWLDASRNIININTSSTTAPGLLNIYGAADVVTLALGRVTGSYDGMLYFTNNEINSGYGKDADSGGLILNHRGYAGGATRARNTYIRNGKNTNLTWWDGTTGRMTHNYEMRTQYIGLADGITAPSAVSGQAFIYVDTSTGDLMVRFGDNVTKTLATDT